VKTQIIQIEPHDDAISLKDKMGWSQTPRILLVWPKQKNVLNRRLDLVYLKRHSNVLGAQLALVTKDSNVRFYARKLNIPVYPSTRKAEASRWRRPIRRKSKAAVSTTHSSTRNLLISKREVRPDLDDLRKSARRMPKTWLVHPITRLFLFSLGVLGVLGIGALLVPSSDIRLTPLTRFASVTIPVAASLQVESSDLSGTVPAKIISVIIEGRGNIPTSGRVKIPDQKSLGKVVFNNLTDNVIEVPSETVVSTIGTDPVRFKTIKAIEISPKTKSELVPVEALIVGSNGNVRSNQIIAIEGPLGLDLTVTNPIGTSHGSDQVSPAPKEKDYQDLLEKLITDLYSSAIDELESQLDQDDLLLWADPEDFEILEAKYTPAEIQPADILILTLRLEYHAAIVPGEEMNDLGQSVLTTNLPADYSPIESSLTIEHLQSPIPDEEMIFRWDMAARWQIRSAINEIDAVRMVLWNKPEDAKKILLNNLPVRDDIEISMTPTWWPRLPILPFRVDVINKSEPTKIP
jgi:hypothetical protein